MPRSVHPRAPPTSIFTRIYASAWLLFSTATGALAGALAAELVLVFANDDALPGEGDALGAQPHALLEARFAAQDLAWPTGRLFGLMGAETGPDRSQ